jgi:KaiC/GvpD/RAD55 family RecA-like ATPase
MFKLSIVNQNNLGEVTPITLASLDDLCIKVLLNSAWAPGVFKENKRTKANFQETHLIALDIDSGLSIDEARMRIIGHGLEAIIAPSKSHQLAKNGTIGDRYRLVFPLDKPITNNEDFEATWAELFKLFPESDRACKDSSRFFYPNTRIEDVTHGKPFPVTKGLPKEQKKVETLPREEKGRLYPTTLQFLLFGAQPGYWHHELYKATLDLKEQGYQEDEVTQMIEEMCQRAETAYEGSLDEHDLHTISDVFENDRGGVHEYREPVKEESIAVDAESLLTEMCEYLSDDVLVSGDPTGFPGLDEMLGGGMRKGEVIAILAKTKNGKSTFVHHLIQKGLAKGTKIAFASRELTPATEVLPNIASIELSKNIWKHKPTDKDLESIKKLIGNEKLVFSPGYGYFPQETLIQWVRTLAVEGYTHFYLDHLLFSLEDSEDFKAAARLAREIKSVTKECNVTFIVVVQPKLTLDGQMINHNAMRGGASLAQAFDAVLILDRQPQQNITKLRLDIARHKLASPGEIYLQYVPETTGFIEVEPEEEPTEPLTKALPGASSQFTQKVNQIRAYPS